MSSTPSFKAGRRCDSCMAEIHSGAPHAMCALCGILVCHNCAPTGKCPNPGCVASLLVVPGESSIRVWGHDARDVERVAGELLTRSRQSEQNVSHGPVGPWSSGSFYLFAVVVLVAIALAAARMVPVLSVPVVLVFALLPVAFIG